MSPNKADVQLKAPTEKCKGCRIIPESGPKCVNCGVTTHPNCVKYLKNVFIIDEERVICCQNTQVGQHGDNGDDLGSSSAITESNAETEMKYLKCLLKSKDLTIEELQKNVIFLQDQIKHLNQLSIIQSTTIQSAKIPQKDTATTSNTKMLPANANREIRPHQTGPQKVWHKETPKRVNNYRTNYNVNKQIQVNASTTSDKYPKISAQMRKNMYILNYKPDYIPPKPSKKIISQFCGDHDDESSPDEFTWPVGLTVEAESIRQFMLEDFNKRKELKKLQKKQSE